MFIQNDHLVYLNLPGRVLRVSQLHRFFFSQEQSEKCIHNLSVVLCLYMTGKNHFQYVWVNLIQKYSPFTSTDRVSRTPMKALHHLW